LNSKPNYIIYNILESNNFLKNILLIAIGILLGFLFIRTTLPSTKAPNKFDELLDIINKNYVDSIDHSAVESKAVNHLLNSLDPHSVYISNEDIQAANEPLLGSFSGLISGLPQTPTCAGLWVRDPTGPRTKAADRTEPHLP
jgi:hypothetical protein